MPEREIPPPSGTLEHYRAEVGRRADALGRRHRQRAVGATATVAVLALVGVVTTVRVTAPPGHVSASSPTSAPGPHAGSGLLRGQNANSAAAGATAAAPQYSAGGPLNQVTVYEKPSGTVVAAGVNQNVLVVLAPIPGGWGRAVLGPGRPPVLTLVSQGEADQVERLRFRTHAVGTATVAVPPTARPASPWRLTVVVKGS